MGRSRSGNRSVPVLPRLNSVTVWPAATASSTIARPTKEVPPRTRRFMRPTLCRDGYVDQSGLHVVDAADDGQVLREVRRAADPLHVAGQLAPLVADRAELQASRVEALGQ